jgi:GNAT superfamily N-acetyltransferase
MREAYDRHERSRGVWPWLRREAGPHLVRQLAADAPTAWIVWSDLGRLPSAEIDALLAAERTRFRRLRRSVEWKAYAHDRPHDLVGRLEVAGFVPAERETLLALDLTDGPAVPSAVTVRHGREAIDGAAAVFRRVWAEQAEEVVGSLRGALRDAPAAVDVVVAEVDGAPVAAGWSSFAAGSPFVGLWGGATVPEARGRGLYRALVAARLEEARRRGRRLAAVDAGPMSRPILERLGFAVLSEITPCLADPGAAERPRPPRG